MSITRSIAILAAAALLAIPSIAVAVGPPTDPGNGHKPAGTPQPATNPSTDAHATASTPAASDTPGPDAPPSVKAKAYGRLCAKESKKHVAGEKGTPFSRCVTAMAKAASGEAKTARAACAGLSREHTAGGHGSQYSRCVAAASRLTNRP
jgi:hypothetical protein